MEENRGQDSSPRRTSLGHSVQPTRHGIASARRVQSVDVTNNKRFTQQRSLGSSLMNSAAIKPHKETGHTISAATAGVFSDEYDLSHTDPDIIQDVQRAVKLAERRATKIQSGQFSSLSKDGLKPDVASGSSISGSSSRRRSLSNDAQQTPFPISVNTSTLDQEPDFYHDVVPSIHDNGKILDWSVHALPEEKRERKWTLSVTKRKGKEKADAYSPAELHALESRYDDKLNRIRAVVNNETQRRADTVKSQLGRRYALFQQYSGFNLAKISRWYGSRAPSAQLILETAEPFSWLEYFTRGLTSATPLSRWHLSAIIMEEYATELTRSNPLPESLQTIQENSSSPVLSNPGKRVSSYFSVIPTSPKRSLERSPVAESLRRPSLDGSRSKSVPSNSPIVERLQVQKRGLRRWDRDSDNESTRNSISERSDDGKYGSRHQSPTRGFGSGRASTLPEFVLSSIPSVGPVEDNMSNFADTSSMERPRSIAERSLKDNSSVRNRYDRKLRRSLPTSEQFSANLERKRLQAADEAKEKEEYALKARLLESTTNQNNRIRQLLNRVAMAIREYETVQSTLMASLGVPHKGLPPDLIIAFGYDPSVVTGGTKKYHGWKAVDEIHDRLARQRQAFHDFLAMTNASPVLPPTDSLLSDPISSLLECLNTLEDRRREIVDKAEKVASLLAQVKAVHAPTKREYNEALSHTSVVYPELSHIIALEESYKDQYQQVWELGMDALTFILDNVTPFWRTYGKTIGDDIQAFLIIPLYRHEFTGEPKRYAITRFPKRSLRHWLGLALFFFCSVGVTFLQTGAGVSSIVYSKLDWIGHSGIRWTVMPFVWIGIFIQWCAVLVEVAVVLIQAGAIVWWLGWSVKIFT